MNTNTPKVSVILTSFNHAKYLREAIDSALAQTFTEFELIIWDDASTDNSWEIIQSYGDPRIKAFRNDEQRRGIYGINKAITEVSQGEYIAIHHSDDVWEREKLKKQVDFLNNHPDIGAVFTNTLAIDEEGEPFSDENHFYYKIFDQPNRTRHEWLRYFFEKGNALCHPSVLIRRQCYKDCGVYRHGFAQLGDFDMWVRLVLRYDIYVVPEKLVRFRVREGEANTSGNRPEVRSRGLYEYSLVINHYLQISALDDLVKVFPEAQKFCNGNNSNLRYALAMAVLEIRPFYFAIQFALNILSEILNDPSQRDGVVFDAKEFIKLTGELDPIQVRRVEQLSQAVVERDLRLADFERIVTELEDGIAALLRAMSDNEEENYHLARIMHSLEDEQSPYAGLVKALIERNHQIAGLRESVRERDERAAALIQQVAERDGQLNGLTQAVAERDALRGTLAEVLASRSWRMTSPVRLIGRRLRQIKIAVLNTSRFLKQEGWVGSLRKSVRILRSEGLMGVRLRLSRGPISVFPAALAHNANETRADSARRGFANASISWDPVRSAYAVVDYPSGYTYVPPRQPDDFNQIISAMRHRPKFSIVVPVYNTCRDLLQKALHSVVSQWYQDWELILVDDASTSEETTNFLAQISEPRVMVLRLSGNKGIAGATNAAIEKAVGDFVVFLDHDDELTEDCLFEIARCVDSEDPDYIYSDEDKISPEGRFVQPHFKPDWSPDTMMSTMYTCHVSCVRRSLLKDIGGLRSEYDGCQDWDLILRLVERTGRIYHIQKVLYHWRVIPGSTAADLAAKPYVLEASKKVRLDAMARRGLLGELEAVDQVPGYFRVRYHMLGRPLISIIIPTRDNHRILQRCLGSILETSSYVNYEIIVVDNGSVEPAAVNYLAGIERAHPCMKVVRHDAPFNFSELNNVGVQAARGEMLLFLNDDTEVISPDWLERMGGYAQLPHVGAVGAKLLYPGGHEVQHAGILNLENGPVHALLRQSPDCPGYFMRNLLEYNWIAVTGACLMVSRDKFMAAGTFNENFPIAYNDVEFCIRLLEAGLYNVVCPAVRLIHHESASRGLDYLDQQKRARLARELRHLYELHPRYFQHDPFYNSNLHPNGIQFELAS